MQERAWEVLAKEWAGCDFDYHVDLHTAGTPLNSTWTYLDRVIYRESGREEGDAFDKAAAEALFSQTLEMASAGFPPPPS